MANEKCWIASWYWPLLKHSLPSKFDAAAAALAAAVGASVLSNIQQDKYIAKY